MIEQDERLGSRHRVFRLGLKVWLQRKTQSTERSEWWGEVYDQHEPSLREGFVGLAKLKESVMAVVRRIQAGERTRVTDTDEEGAAADPGPAPADADGLSLENDA